MQITWIQQTTLVDYPWKVASIVFTAGCQFRCPFCYNPQAVLPELIARYRNQQIPEEAIFNFLQQRKGLIDGVSICWWEPTIQSDLYDFAEKIKKMWFCVKLDTNGRDVKLVKKMVEDWILDYVAVDLKWPLSNYEKRSWVSEFWNFLENYKELLDFLKSGVVDYEYRSTLIKWFHEKEDLEEMGMYLQWIKARYLQNYLPEETLDPNFIGEPFTWVELQELKKIANKYVEFCSIRW